MDAPEGKFASIPCSQFPNAVDLREGNASLTAQFFGHCNDAVRVEGGEKG